MKKNQRKILELKRSIITRGKTQFIHIKRSISQEDKIITIYGPNYAT